MVRSTPVNVQAQSAAVIAGAFLAGAMMSISFIAVPVLTDVNANASHLLRQWATLYGYGVKLMPPAAITTLLLYSIAIFNQARSSRPWLIYAFAAIATVGIIPFTKLVMLPTNNQLFELDAQAQSGAAQSLGQVHELIEKWRLLHIGRSVFPLAGAALGITGTLQELLA